MLYVIRQLSDRRPIFIATLRAGRLLAGCFVAHRSKTTAGMLTLRFAHPVKERGSAAIPVTDLVHWVWRMISFLEPYSAMTCR